MIFVDATSSSKSPLNTGVQRVVRSLFAALRRQAGDGVVPIVWDDQLRSYCRLSRRERGFLENAFARSPAAAREPEHAANPWPWSKVVRHLGHRVRRFDLAAQTRAEDVIFVAEIFQDGRTECLSKLAPRSAARRVAVFHDAITYRRPDLSPPKRVDGFEAYLDALATFDVVFADSAFSAGELAAIWRERGVAPAARLSQRGLCIDATAARPDSPPPTLPRILCVSTLEARKNHLVLLEACERLWAAGRRFHLDLIGRTTRHWGERVVLELDRLRHFGRELEWHLHVDDERLGAAYHDAWFTVFPSVVEGFGLPILESLWHRRPCVCAGFGAMGEIAAGGGCETADVLDVGALAEAIDRLLTDPARLAGRTAEATARTFPTWDQYARELLTDWREV